MPYDPFTVDGKVYEVVSGSGTVYEDAVVFLYDVTTGGYMHTTTNASGEYSLDLSDDTISTWEEWSLNDKLQLYVIDANSIRSMCARHTIVSGDSGNWNQDLYLHETINPTFRLIGTTPSDISKLYVNHIIASNNTSTPQMVWFFNKTNDTMILQIEVPANNTIPLNLGGLFFDGGICPIYEETGNDGAGSNKIEVQIIYE